MPTTIKAVVEAFELLFESILQRDFSKSQRMESWDEQQLLPVIRTFLLGYFGACQPEAKANLPGSVTGNGRFDFIVDDVAVEFATRRPDAPKGELSVSKNEGEIKKLLKNPGKSLLVLFDFSKSRCPDSELKKYRAHPPLGRGNSKSPFKVAYFFLANRRPKKPDKIILSVRRHSRLNEQA